MLFVAPQLLLHPCGDLLLVESPFVGVHHPLVAQYVGEGLHVGELHAAQPQPFGLQHGARRCRGVFHGCRLSVGRAVGVRSEIAKSFLGTAGENALEDFTLFLALFLKVLICSCFCKVL